MQIIKHLRDCLFQPFKVRPFPQVPRNTSLTGRSYFVSSGYQKYNSTSSSMDCLPMAPAVVCLSACHCCSHCHTSDKSQRPQNRVGRIQHAVLAIAVTPNFPHSFPRACSSESFCTQRELLSSFKQIQSHLSKPCQFSYALSFALCSRLNVHKGRDPS